MKNYVCLNGKKIEFTAEQVKEIEKILLPKVRLGDVQAGKTATIGDCEYIVLKHDENGTHLLMRNFLDTMKFGDSCDFKKSDVKKVLDKFADELASSVGEDHIFTHEVDLTSDDGLKDYGTTTARVSLLTCNMYREHVEIIDKYEVNDYWWLATPWSTPKHYDSTLVKCVSPSGGIGNGNCSYNGVGVRPFCILNSDIFVS